MNVSRIGMNQNQDKLSNDNHNLPRWLGIDPGLATLRWAVLEENEHNMPKLLDYGTINTPSKRPNSERLWELEQDLVALLNEFKPKGIALEKPLFNTEFKSMEGLIEAMGVIHLVCYRETGIIPIHLFSHNWKAEIADTNAEPEEITDTIAYLFDLSVSPKKRLDAIGIAYAAFCGVGFS
jgi:crossover junction endodeoxyribonuclease RuvC